MTDEQLIERAEIIACILTRNSDGNYNVYARFQGEQSRILGEREYPNKGLSFIQTLMKDTGGV